MDLYTEWRKRKSRNPQPPVRVGIHPRWRRPCSAARGTEISLHQWMYTINTEGIRKLLTDLNPNKASGPDEVPCRLLKELADELAPVLQVLFEQSLRTGTVPTDWKGAKITPVFKKGNVHLPENYRLRLHVFAANYSNTLYVDTLDSI